MPLYKQPKSLRDLSIRVVSHLVQTACLNILARHPRSKDECFVEVDVLQRYLLPRIRPLLDEIYKYTFSNGDALTLHKTGSLLLATFMHKYMKVLSYHHDPTKIKNSFMSGTALWEKFLQKVPNLVELDLSGAGCEINEILHILGKSNTNLEIITLIGYQVSGNGLLSLSTIKTLRQIRNFHSDSLYLTRGGNDIPCVRILLQLLPLLEHIHCSCIGDVLINLTYLQPLALQYCCDMQPTTRKLKAMARLCPNLKRLELGDPFITQQLLDFTCLTESTLTVSSLKLVDFCFTADLNGFFFQKGKYLSTLELVNFTDLNLEKIKLIGTFCRGLQVLRIYLDPDCLRLHRKGINTTREKYKENRRTERMFENLVQFEQEIYADEQIDETGVLMCLVHSLGIESITFRRLTRGSLGDTGTLDHVLRKLVMLNPMLRLTTLVLLGPFKLSVNTIRYFYSLPQLAKLTLYVVYSPDVNAYLKQMVHEINCFSVNLDLSLWLSSTLLHY